MCFSIIFWRPTGMIILLCRLASLWGVCIRCFFASFRVLPFEVKQLLPFLVKNRRLESYARLSRSAKFLGSCRDGLHCCQSRFAIEVLEAEYRVLHTSFTSFFQDIMDEIEANDGIMLRRTGETA
jgi:hypothetical protein